MSDPGLGGREGQGGCGQSVAPSRPPSAVVPIFSWIWETGPNGAAESSVMVGALGYRAPELLFGDAAFGCAVDLFARGAAVAAGSLEGCLGTAAAALGKSHSLVRFTRLFCFFGVSLDGAAFRN